MLTNLGYRLSSHVKVNDVQYLINVSEYVDEDTGSRCVDLSILDESRGDVLVEGNFPVSLLATVKQTLIKFELSEEGSRMAWALTDAPPASPTIVPVAPIQNFDSGWPPSNRTLGEALRDNLNKEEDDQDYTP